MVEGAVELGLIDRIAELLQIIINTAPPSARKVCVGIFMLQVLTPLSIRCPYSAWQPHILTTVPHLYSIYCTHT
jgi:hypothetical protein